LAPLAKSAIKCVHPLFTVSDQTTTRAGRLSSTVDRMDFLELNVRTFAVKISKIIMLRPTYEYISYFLNYVCIEIIYSGYK